MKNKQVISILLLMITALLIYGVYQQYHLQTEGKVKTNDLLIRQKIDIQYDRTQLERRLNELNENLEGLYALLELVEIDLRSNQQEIRQLYQSNLKYAFEFTPRNVSTLRLIDEYTSSSFQADELHDELIRLHYEQLKATTDQKGILALRNSNSWSNFFSEKVDLMTFEFLGDQQVIVQQFKNIIVEYIKEVEISFLSLQSLQNQYIRTEELLDLELSVREIDVKSSAQLDSIQ